MATYQYSKENIQARTGLTFDFINLCNSKLSDLLSSYRIKGDKNKILYDDNGLRLWDVIKQRKERGENIRQIREALEDIVRPASQGTEPTPKTTSDTSPFESQNSRSRGGEMKPQDTGLFIEAFLEMSKAHRAELSEQHKGATGALRGHIQALQGQILLLTDGRSTEQVHAELRQAAKDKAELTRLRDTLEEEEGKRSRRRALITKLERTSKWNRKRRRELLEELRSLDS